MKAWFMFACLPSLACAQEKWNVNTFAKEAKSVKFSVNEGTWINFAPKQI